MIFNTVFAEGGILSTGADKFNPRSAGALKIGYQVAVGGRVDLAVYNRDGKEIRILSEESKEPGSYTCDWDGKDSNGAWVGPGRYRLVIEGRRLFVFKDVTVTAK